MKKFKYKLAISNYDRELIDWCIGIGYECDRNNYGDFLYFVSNWTGLNRSIGYSIQFNDRFQDYLINYKENPKLTKALLAAVDHKKGHTCEIVKSITTGKLIHLKNAKGGGFVTPNKCWIARNGFVKPTLDVYLDHFNCKLSGKDIVSRSKKIEVKDIPVTGQIKKELGILIDAFKRMDKILNNLSEKEIDKKTYLERLRTEHERLKAKIHDMTYTHQLKGSYPGLTYLEWNNKLNRIHLNVRDIERILHKKSPTNLPHGIGVDVSKLIKVPFRIPYIGVEDLKQAAKDCETCAFGHCAFCFDGNAEDKSKCWKPKGYKRTQSEIDEEFDRIMEEFKELGSTPQDVSKLTLKVPFGMPDKDFDIIDKNCKLMHKGKDINPNNHKPIRLVCKNKDCKYYNPDRKSNCSKLFPSIHNQPEKAKCRDYEEKESLIPLGFIEDYQVFINKNSCQFYGHDTRINFDKMTDMVKSYKKTDRYTKTCMYFDNGEIKMKFSSLSRIYQEMLKLRKCK